MTISERISTLMLKNNISISTLSKKAGISQERIKSWKISCKPSVQELYSVSHTLNVTMDYMVTGNPSNEFSPEFVNKVSLINERGRRKLLSYLDGLLENDQFIDKNIAAVETAAIRKEVA